MPKAEGSRHCSNDVNLRYYSAHPHKLSEFFTFWPIWLWASETDIKIMRSLGTRVTACDRSDVINAEQMTWFSLKYVIYTIVLLFQ